jgi:hypothetical protein
MDFAPFISGWYIGEDVCDQLIKYFEDSPIKATGMVGGFEPKLDPEQKDSMDVFLDPKDPDPLIQNYLNELGIVCNKYRERYPWCDIGHHPWSVVRNFNIQRYLPGQGFKRWHCERSGPSELSVYRHLVFMTYLNDVTVDGGTEWFHQQITVQPKKGLTVIWPSDWTHMHRGVVSNKETKYIVTGWYSYNTEDNK